MKFSTIIFAAALLAEVAFGSALPNPDALADPTYDYEPYCPKECDKTKTVTDYKWKTKTVTDFKWKTKTVTEFKKKTVTKKIVSTTTSVYTTTKKYTDTVTSTKYVPTTIYKPKYITVTKTKVGNSFLGL
ncbi:hypothetical protein ABW19_dt0210285 [Dactylella cylindrospora]|nr:hypothetical protein ABW19_dt0210285 [Dactylella cylindrospora]